MSDIDKAIARTAFRLYKDIVESIPVRTGRLRQSIVIKKDGDDWVIGTNVPYMTYLELGTGIYGENKQPIRPKRAKYLHWKDFDTGLDIFAKEVKGIKPHRIFEKAMQKAKTYFDEEMKK